MARRFRRRRRTGLWIPVIGNFNQQNSEDAIIGIQGYTPVTNDGLITVTADEVTFDYNYNSATVQSTATDFSPNLHDITSGGEWRLRRIVGKCHASFGNVARPTSSTTQSYMPACEYATGYIVLKTDEEGAPLTDLDEVNPLVAESADDPWIWRRKWILSNGVFNNRGTRADPYLPATSASTDADFGQYWRGMGYPPTTANYGSVADGPHIDQKTNRVIHRQERLFFVSAARMWAPVPWSNPAQFETHLVCYHVDHRFFGMLSSSRGNRRNASR